MNTHPAWFYNEIQHSGVDYSDPAQVAVYDERHEKFRDYEKATEAVLQRLALGPEHTVIDMGAGTGAFALHVARRCKWVYAVDISQAMLDYARQKAERAALNNISFCHGGFLTYEHTAEPVDAIISAAALHHLPDFWKQVALRRLTAMLKPGGKFYLFDIVFPGDLDGYEACFDAWEKDIREKTNVEFAAEVATHIRDEHSTFDWIMESLLERAGFRIDTAEYGEGFGATYICTRP